MTLAIDASVALKLVLVEDGSDRARELLAGSEPLVAPDFLTLEAANVLAVMTRRSLLDASASQETLSYIGSAPIRLLPSQPHFAEAFRLAVRFRQSAYDCLYLALALAERATLITADRRFAEAVQKEPAYTSAVRLL